MDAEMDDLTGVEVDTPTNKRKRDGNGRVRMTGNHVSFQTSKAMQPLLANSDDTDTKSGESSDEELPNGTEVKASKPLIHSRQKMKVVVARRRCCHRSMMPILGFTILGFCAVLVSTGFIMKFSRRLYLALHPPTNVNEDVYLPCSSLNVSDVWVVGFPKLLTESAIRMVDVNSDGVLDVVLGFATGADGFHVPDFVCDIYFQSQKPCLGGVLALNGATGAVLWKHYAPHEVFAVNCIADLNKDNTSDCVIAGRAAILEAISGRDGSLLWTFVGSEARNDKMNVYTVQFVYDFDGDAVPEIVVGHGGDPFGEPGSATRLVGKLLIISGRHGRVLQWADMPDQRETYFSPVVYERNSGVPVVLFGSGGETHPGALWAVELADLYTGRMDRAVSIYSNRYKGVMTPPVLIDITGDGVLDIVLADFNSSVVAIDGEKLTQLWNFTYQNSAETYATPAPGFYNNDSVPDFMITFQEGPGFPVYYKAMATVLDGRTGQPILQPYLTSSVGAQTSPITLSMKGVGQDMFVYWTADCKGHEGGDGGEFEFAKGTNIHEQSRTDFCRQRFQSYGYSRMMAISQFKTSPSFVIYNSELREDIEKSVWVNTTAEALTFLQDHPDFKRLWQSSKHPQTKTQTRRPVHRPLEEYPEERREAYDDNSNYYYSRRRGRRHVGPHDDDGVQRLISTGTLAPPLLPTNHSDYNRSMDVVFATYWFFPAKTEVLLPEDRACVEQRMAGEEERFDPASNYYGMDDDAYEHAVTTECLEKSGHLPEQGATYESQTAYDPFNIHMGQLTIYRLRLTCQCDVAPSAGQQCGQFVPFASQRWAGYMGSKATSHWNSLAHA